MKNYLQVCLLVAGLLMLPGVVGAGETGSARFQEMSSHYEAIRLALLNDSMGGVTEHSQSLAEMATDLRKTISADLEEVSTHDLEARVAALGEIEYSAMELAQASDLTAAREGLFGLTKPMAKYRKLTGDQSTVVAYCPMAQKAWIQPEGEIGNPYLGQEMPNCGEVVGE